MLPSSLTERTKSSGSTRYSFIEGIALQPVDG
ncbi:Versicolorin B synthase [Venturia inaequalis]|nr:Versicolorin B synthase [Venturia inaequalis]